MILLSIFGLRRTERSAYTLDYLIKTLTMVNSVELGTKNYSVQLSR